MIEIKLNTSNAIKGLVALIIILHHISLDITHPTILYLFQWLGCISVSLFFFLSGYGLTYQLKMNDNYLNTFWKCRIFKVLIPFILSNLIFIIFNHFYFKVNYSLKNIIPLLIGIKQINPITWFVKCLIWLYIGFYFSFNFTKKIYLQFTFLYLFVIVWVFWIIMHGSHLFISVFAFPLGVYCVKYSNKISSNIPRIITILIFIVFCYLFYEVSKMKVFFNLRSILIGIVECLCFTIFIVLIMRNIEIKNQLFKFIGSISYEIYLIQGIFLHFIFKSNELLSIAIIMPSTLIASYGFKLLNSWITSKLIK